MTDSGGSATASVGVNEADRARNRAMGAGLVDDPYPRYHELRATGPVHQGTIPEHLGIADARGTHPDGLDFSAYDWATVDEILRDNESFSNASYAPTLEPFIGRTILQMDEPEHRRYRGLAQPGLARADMARWQATWVDPYLARLFETIRAQPGQRADLNARLCSLLPVHTIAKAWGIADTDIDRVHELAISQLTPSGDYAAAIRAAEELAGLLREQIAQRRVEPADDLISLMCTAEVVDDDGDPHRLADDEVLAFARLLLTAGAGTTYRGLGSLLVALLSNPDQLVRLRDDRSLLEPAVEEGLRWEQPLSAVTRLAARDAELGGVAIPAGSFVHAAIGAANHDPARWDDPDRFDIGRPPQPHVTFGGGAHFCIGVHLARMEMKAGLDAVLDQLPGIRFDPDEPVPHITGLTFRMPTAVPVTWD
jgi:cytochrome P450